MIAAVLDFIANIFALILLLGVFLVVWTTPFGQPVTFEFYRRNDAFGIIIIHQDRAQALQVPIQEPETEDDPWAGWPEEDPDWEDENDPNQENLPPHEGWDQPAGDWGEARVPLGNWTFGTLPCPPTDSPDWINWVWENTPVSQINLLLDRFIFRQYQINTISQEGHLVGTSSIFGPSPTYSTEEANYHLGEPEEGPAETDLLPAFVLGWVPIIEDEEPPYQVFPFATEDSIC
jgi:hypothetical protein